MILFQATYFDGHTEQIDLTQYSHLFNSAAEIWAAAAREAALIKYQSPEGIAYPLDKLEIFGRL